MSLIGSDIFKSMEFVNQIQRKFYDGVDENTLAIGTFGAEAELFGRTLQNSIRVASELSSEAIPNRAKYDKNILAHAHYVGVSNLEATPAYMPVQIIIPKDQIEEKMDERDRFIWDSNITIEVEGMEFHTDYDIIITRNKIGSNKFVFTALYDMTIDNPVSDITKPYLPPVGIVSTVSGDMLIVSCIVRQVSHVTVNHRILSDNDIENKTFTFSFEDQLAGFDLDATEGDTTYRITPIYDGAINNTSGYTCEYQYIDTSTIRVKFTRDSYYPKINANININLKLTKGAKGNFTAPKEILVDVSSTKYNYKGLYASVMPSGDSDEGRDKKTTEEIKSDIPKEAMSRGTISTTTDLENFFNSFNTDDSKLYPYKRKYNGIDYIYYLYLVMKKNGNVVPTNTIPIAITNKELSGNSDAYIIPTLSSFVYDSSTARLVTDTDSLDRLDDLETFIYTNPYMIVINKNPLMVSYYLNIIDTTKYVEYDYINQSVQLQMIMSSISIIRSGVTDRNNYHISFQMTQNIDSDYGMVTYDEDDVMDDSNIKVFLVFFNEDNTNVPIRYIQCKLENYNDEEFIYTYEAILGTDDTILSDNRIKINNLKQPISGLDVDSYLENGCTTMIYIFGKLDRKYGEDVITQYIPDLDGYSLCNKYKISGGIDLFYNYTQLMNSNPNLTLISEGEYRFEIASVPMVRRSYLKSESKISSIVSELETRREYIEYCLDIIEGGFDIDFKFVNTYGPSKRFTLKDGSPINRVNMTVEYEAKLYSSSDKYIIDLIIQDIKDSIEDINSISELHFSNLTTTIKDKYTDQLYYFEFLGFNGYGPGQQYIKSITTGMENDTPEFLNVNTLDSDEPDIIINVL